ncbi:hypothetical protein [Klebsiella quasipneumoniae]|uniref:hypothetical protein n=1 Tax=Klebsiella quasipneumoniae TaxID=1463165 RepID=UPI002B062154|nr:hypothetical protein [Klebsiella quasipneumoniae]
MKEELLLLRNQLKMGHRISFAEAMLLQRAIDILVNKAGNSPAIPDGYVMVPKEPTVKMIWAAKYAMPSTVGWQSFKDVYIAMLAAAPQETNS